MANINISYEQLEHVANQLANGREEITTKLNHLETQITQLITSGFVTDQASGKLGTAFTEYTRGAHTVIEKLTEIKQFLEQTATAMRELDAQIAARIS